MLGPHHAITSRPPAAASGVADRLVLRADYPKARRVSRGSVRAEMERRPKPLPPGNSGQRDPEVPQVYLIKQDTDIMCVFTFDPGVPPLAEKADRPAAGVGEAWEYEYYSNWPSREGRANENIRSQVRTRTT